MRNYLRMTAAEKSRLQDTIFKQMRYIQTRHYDNEEEWLSLSTFYLISLKNAEEDEDYELCLAIKESAQKHGVRING